MRILAIDPGPQLSAWIVTAEDMCPVSFDKEPNGALLDMLADADVDLCAIEMISSYGMPVGAEVFETCIWIGRFTQARESAFRDIPLTVYRRDVKLHLCGSARAKDANVRQALIDRYGPGKERAIGRKASPGALYGVTGDVWAALAVAVTVHDTLDGKVAA